MRWQLKLGMAGSDPRTWKLDPTVIEADSEKQAVDRYYRLKVYYASRGGASLSWVLNNVRSVVMVKTKEETP
jgi:hypothetical protein